ncbi:hypothetical protein DH2020_036958 [Rehmannia glutinosa]|uniref:ZF-HD dimerization-type domain-containing protein n=1 Tax=Rehmannia glutinosa TaxID=99300 RepID=A0ABR0V239_REHGL
MPSPTSNPTEPTSLKCAACGCHRNFHRREPEEPPPPPNATPALEYQPHHRHHPPPPPARGNNSGSSPNNSPSPPPISSSYYPSAPHMLLALSHGLSGPPPDNNTPISTAAAAINAISTPLLNSSSRKRFRTKFTHHQKEKMLELAEKVGWKMQKRDEDLINQFCTEISVDKGVFKVWMHNNKNTFGKKDQNQNPPPPHFSNNSASISPPPPSTAANGNGLSYGGNSTDVKLNVSAIALGTNGSSSSS